MRLQRAHRLADPDEPAAISIGELLRKTANRVPDRIALVDGAAEAASRRRVSYAEVLALAEAGARDLLQRFPDGGNIAIWASNSIDWVILEFSAALAGLPLVMINPALTGHEASYILQQSKAVAIFVAESYRNNPLARRIEEIRHTLPKLRYVSNLSVWAAALKPRSDASGALPQVPPGATFAIQYTSGTTGKPKGAVQTHLAAVNVSLAVTKRQATTLGSTWLLPLPLYSVGGSVYVVLGSLWNEGATIVLPDFDEGLILQLVEEENVTFFTAVPTMYLRIFDHADFGKRDLKSLEVLVCGGSTVPEELVRKIERDFGAEYMMMFGLTEMCGAVCQTVRGDTTFHKARTVGAPLPGIETKIISTETGEIMGVGEPGEICVRGVGRISEYFEMPEATALAIDADGWLHTGDIGTLAEDGYCAITGRLKDMIRRGGVNIYPREIEDVLSMHSAIAESVAFGIADERWGEQVAVCIRLKPDTASPAIQELEDFLREHIARHKVPKFWKFVEHFPVNAMGKVQKNILREEFVARHSKEGSDVR
jgi:fatty-acyl-CoA synthase